MSVSIDVSYGELIDKITILEIKAARITDAVKLRNVKMELQFLAAQRAVNIPPSVAVEVLTNQLRTVNAFLWDVEDQLREKEARKLFDAEFVELARNVYRTNDRRAELKRALNNLLGSKIMEEKAYKPYS